MKFEKFLFNISLNGWSAAKYVDDNGSVKIVIENSNNDQSGGSIEFESHDDYRKWIDGIVDDQTAIYNQAQALQNVFDALSDEYDAKEDRSGTQ